MDDAYDRLRQLLQEQGLSQSWLARILGVDRSLISRAFRCRTGLERHWPTICTALKVSADWLIFGGAPNDKRTSYRQAAEEDAPYLPDLDAGDAHLLLAQTNIVRDGDLMAIETIDGRHLIGLCHPDGDALRIDGPAGTALLPAVMICSRHRVIGWRPGPRLT